MTEQWRKDATIKVKTLMDVKQESKNSFHNNFKLVNISIRKPTYDTSQSFELNPEGTIDALKFLKDELYLKGEIGIYNKVALKNQIKRIINENWAEVCRHGEDNDGSYIFKCQTMKEILELL